MSGIMPSMGFVGDFIRARIDEERRGVAERERVPNPWPGRLVRALSFRIILGSLFAGLCMGVASSVFGAPASWLMPVVWITAGVCYVGAVLNDGQMVSCDACRKRVKIGAVRCHHCGYQRSV